MYHTHVSVEGAPAPSDSGGGVPGGSAGYLLDLVMGEVDVVQLGGRPQREADARDLVVAQGQPLQGGQQEEAFRDVAETVSVQA